MVGKNVPASNYTAAFIFYKCRSILDVTRLRRTLAYYVRLEPISQSLSIFIRYKGYPAWSAPLLFTCTCIHMYSAGALFTKRAGMQQNQGMGILRPLTFGYLETYRYSNSSDMSLLLYPSSQVLDELDWNYHTFNIQIFSDSFELFPATRWAPSSEDSIPNGVHCLTLCP